MNNPYNYLHGLATMSLSRKGRSIAKLDCRTVTNEDIRFLLAHGTSIVIEGTGTQLDGREVSEHIEAVDVVTVSE